MNLWVKKTGLILGSALLIFACEEPGEIGLDLNPEQERFVLSSVEIPVDVSVGWAEPYLLYDQEDRGLGAINIGKRSDLRFGTVQLEGYSQLVVSRDTVKLPANAAYYKTSVSLYVTNLYVDTADFQREQVVRLHELTEEMDSVNYSNTSYAYDPEPLGEVKFHLDSMVNGLTARADLSDELGMKIFEELKDSLLTTADLGKIIKGVAFVPDESNNMLFSLLPFDEITTGIEVQYISGSDTSSARYLFEGIHSYRVQSDFTGTELAGLQQGGTPANDLEYGYLGAASGLYSTLDFSPVLALRDSLGKMVINNAQVHFFEDALNDSTYKTPTTIFAFDNNANFKLENVSFFGINLNQGAYINSDKIGHAFRFALGAGLDKDKNRIYTIASQYAGFNNYIQNLVSGKLPEDQAKLIITPSAFGRSFHELAFNKNAVRLKIYFSYLKE